MQHRHHNEPKYQKLEYNEWKYDATRPSKRIFWTCPTSLLLVFSRLRCHHCHPTVILVIVILMTLPTQYCQKADPSEERHFVIIKKMALITNIIMTKMFRKSKDYDEKDLRKEKSSRCSQRWQRRSAGQRCCLLTHQCGGSSLQLLKVTTINNIIDVINI